jgi:hypothetical protein
VAFPYQPPPSSAAPPAPPNPQWEDVAYNTRRLKVPGGWLYHYANYASNDGSMCFVPYHNNRYPL